MLKISLMDQSDLEEAFKIEEQTNPSPWSKENFFHLLMWVINHWYVKLAKK